MSTKAERKLNLSALCDADQYEPVVAGCLTEKQAKSLPARHLANGLSLMAELMLTHYDGIAEAFTTNNGVEVSLKLAIGPQKDELKIAYKPTSEVKDAAMATVPDPDQVEMDFVKPRPPAAPAPQVAPVVEIQALPAPALGLPAPEQSEEEREAYEKGAAAAIEGSAFSTNPYTYRSAQWRAWADGWRAEADEGDPEASDDAGPMDLREDLTDHSDEEE
ncbi:MAG TPA: hypothetical protein VGE67_11620 [Haloferula sp.]